mmetsp:Transcript_5955/g.15836  ORF Transcript_5955/g.15836 Transcript_5955/m.15836 type:complete len:120 (-) Transcript_5955:1752-2111(-)
MYLNLIREKCKNNQYESSEQFLDDLRLLVSNAKAFNTQSETQWIVQHAELLLETAEEKIASMRKEIRAAEKSIEQQKQKEKESELLESPSTEQHRPQEQLANVEQRGPNALHDEALSST